MTFKHENITDNRQLNAGILVINLLLFNGLIETKPLPACNNPWDILIACNVTCSLAYYSANDLNIDAILELLVPNPINPRAIIALVANIVSCCYAYLLITSIIVNLGFDKCNIDIHNGNICFDFSDPYCITWSNDLSNKVELTSSPKHINVIPNKQICTS